MTKMFEDTPFEFDTDKTNLTYKQKLFAKGYEFIPLFSTCNLPMREECLVNYLMDLSSFTHSDKIRFTPGFVQKKKPNWKIYDIRQATKSLVNLGFITKVRDTGRGVLYEFDKNLYESALEEFTD